MEGRNKRKTRTFSTIEEARLELRKHEVRMMEGNAVDPSRATVNEAIERHLEVSSFKLEKSTLYGYQTISQHIKSSILGGKQVQDVKPTDIQSYLSHIQRVTKLSSNTALKHYNF